MSRTRSGWKGIVAGLMVGLLAASSASGQVDALSQAMPPSDAPAAAAPRVIRAPQGVEHRIALADGRRLSLAADGTSLTLWDVLQKRVIRTHRLPVPRINASLTLLPSGRVLLWGGATARGDIQTDGFWFDPGLKTLEPASDLGLLPRAGHTATVLTDGRVLFAGGRSKAQAAELWDERSNRSIRVPMKAAEVRSGRRAELQSDGRVRLWGGATAVSASVTADLVFDPASNQFASDATNARATAAELPGLAASLPAQGAQTVAPDARLSLRFTQPVRMADLSTASTVLVGPGGATAVRVTPVENGRLVFVTPTQALFPDSRYTLMVDGVRTQAGERVPLITVDFKTAALPVEDTANAAKDPADGVVPSTVQITGATGAKTNAEGCEIVAGVGLPCRATSTLDKGVWTPGRNNVGGRWRVSGAQPELSPSGVMAHITEAVGFTTVIGRILRVDGVPVSNVDVSIGTLSVRTDAQGNFTLYNAPAGKRELYVDGSTANGPDLEYGQFVVGVDVKAGKLTQLPYTMYLPRVTARDKIRIPSPLTRDLVLKHPDMPGLMVQIPAGTVIRDRKGRIVRELAIVPTPVNRAPFPVADNYPLYFTLEPGGAVIQGLTPESAKGIRVFYPNYDRRPKGTQANFWIYDPADGWRVYGKGRVTTDGKYFSPEAGVALFQTMGGSYSVNTTDDATEDDQPTCHESCGSANSGGGATASDPIDLRTGEFVYQETDAAIDDISSIGIGRSYRPNDGVRGVFGYGITANFGYSLFGTGTYDTLKFILPRGVGIPFQRTSGSGLNGTWQHSGSNTIFNAANITFVSDAKGHGYRMTLRDGSVMQFGNYNPNPLQWSEDRYGNRTSYTYDAGLLTRITSPSGRYLQLTYDTDNRIRLVQDSIGRSWTYAYNGYGLLETVTSPDGKFKRYDYIVEDKILRGSTTIASLNSPSNSPAELTATAQRVSNQDAASVPFPTGPLPPRAAYGHRIRAIYDRRGTRILYNEYATLTSPGPSPMTYTLGQVAKQTLADGSTYQINYQHVDGNTSGVLVTQPDGSKRRIVFAGKYPSSDTSGYGTPLAQTYRFERSLGNDWITARIDSLGRRTEYVYDSTGQVTKLTALAGTPQARVMTMTYTSDGDLATVKDPLSRVTTLTYVNRCLTSIKDPLGHSTRISCNSAGQPVSVTDANNNSTVLTYLGYDLAAISDPLNRTVQFRYDALGRVTATQDAEGNVSRREYDAMGRVKKSYDAHDRITEMGYDANGNVTAVLLPNGNGITYTYDTRDRVTDRTDSLSQQEAWTYDLLDRVKTYTDRKGQVTTTDYDVLGRPTLTTYPGTAGSVTATYDAGDRLRTLVDTISGTLGWDYDDFDQVLQTTTPQGSVGYTYDAVNRRRSMTAGSQAAVTYDYDNADLLRKIQQGSEIVTMDYDPGNRLTLQTLPNGIKTAYTYNAASQLTGLGWAKADGSLLGDLGYGYNSVGRQVAQTGSFASQNLPTASTGTNSFDDSNRQTAYNGQTLTYDVNGNLTADGTRTYVWNAKDQLVQVKQGSTVLASYAYDALGRRITRTEGGQATAYLYDGLDAVQETQGATTYPSLTGLGIDQRFARTEGSGRTYFLSDGLGSTKALTNASGAILNRYDYSPYGETTHTASGFANPYQYTGREKDANGLYYYRARYYHPGMGRFISEDPIGLAGGLNSYAYVGGNPINSNDPTGLVVNVVSSNAATAQRLMNAYGVLNARSAAARNVNGYLENSTTTYEIRYKKNSAFYCGNGQESRCDGHANTVFIDPCYSPDISTTDGMQPIPLPVMLGHELGHAFGYLDNVSASSPRGDNVDMVENPIRDDFGLPRRETYYDPAILPTVRAAPGT